MAIDPPATIAILGAGPIGLEAALYARFLGYDVIIFEKGNEVADHVRQWRHLRLVHPFDEMHSTLGMAAVRMHHEEYVPPGNGEMLTGHEWRERYLIPLSQTDLLADHVRLGRVVLGVSKTEITKVELEDDEERGDWMFRILSRDAAGQEFNDEVEMVIDATGTFSQPNWAGEGGLPAIGERAARAAKRIDYFLPDVLGIDRERFAGKHTLVFGNKYGNGPNNFVTALAELEQDAPGTRVSWALQGPNVVVDGRDTMGHNWLQQVVEQDGRLHVTIAGSEPQSGDFDQIIADVGYRPDHSLYEELHVREHSEYRGSAKTREPNFYVLGNKSAGRSRFSFQEGLKQIRDVFAIIGDRATLDLYANAPR